MFLKFYTVRRGTGICKPTKWAGKDNDDKKGHTGHKSNCKLDKYMELDIMGHKNAEKEIRQGENSR